MTKRDRCRGTYINCTHRVRKIDVIDGEDYCDGSYCQLFYEEIGYGDCIKDCESYEYSEFRTVNREVI